MEDNKQSIVIRGVNAIEPRDVFYQAIEPVANLTYATVNYSPTNMLPVVQSILQQLKHCFQIHAAQFQPNIQLNNSGLYWGKLAQKMNCAIINVYTRDTDYMGPHTDT